jgi:O-antigen/teichoic acid export membrane protein
VNKGQFQEVFGPARKDEPIREGQPQAAGAADLGRRALGGAFWLAGERGYRQVLYLVRAIVLARLLTPLDFGLVAIGDLSIHFLGIFSNFGFESALMQRPNPTPEALHTTYWAKVGRTGLTAGVLWWGAPVVAAWFHAPQAVWVLRAMAFIALLQGLDSLSFILWRKDLQFRQFFRYEALGLTLDLLVTVTAAAIWHNVWALVLGSLAGTLFRFAYSFFRHPYRPKLVFAMGEARELFSFGKWLLLSSIMLFLITKGTDTLSGFFFGAAALGLYQMASRFALIPANHLADTLFGVMFPAYSLIQEDRLRLAAVFLKVLQVTAFVIFPMAALLAVTVGPALPLFLGSQWQGLVTLVPWLALGGGVQALLRTGSPVFLASGRPNYQFAIDLVAALGILLAVWPLSQHFGLAGLALAYGAGISLGLPLWALFICRQLHVKGRELAISLVPALLGSLLLSAVVLVPGWIWHLRLTGFHNLGLLVILSILGAASYVIFISLAECYFPSGYQPIKSTWNLVQAVRQRSREHGLPEPEWG